MHHKTAEQVYFGAAGMIFVRDDNPVGKQLPRTYGVDDFPLVIQDKSFDENNVFIHEALADTMMVNGTLGAYLDVPAQMVRFHLLNASNQRVYYLGLPPGLNAWQIGSDGGFLKNTIPLHRIQLTPGERIEMVIDFSNQTNKYPKLVAYNSELPDGFSGGPKGPKGGPNNKLDSADFDVLEFHIQTPTANPITSIPNNLNTYDKPSEAEVDKYRTKIFTVDASGFPFYINNTLMDIDVINDTVILDQTEVWTIINNTDVVHPWHIHDVQFSVLDINGTPPPPDLAGRKDVIAIMPYDTVRYITKFEDFTNPEVPYMYHCHNLFHEDAGMMGQFIVVDSNWLASPEVKINSNLKIYPNPAYNYLNIQFLNDNLNGFSKIEIYSLEGKKLEEVNLKGNHSTTKIEISNLEVGLYILKLVSTNEEAYFSKFQKI